MLPHFNVRGLLYRNQFHKSSSSFSPRLFRLQIQHCNLWTSATWSRSGHQNFHFATFDAMFLAIPCAPMRLCVNRISRKEAQKAPKEIVIDCYFFRDTFADRVLSCSFHALCVIRWPRLALRAAQSWVNRYLHRPQQIRPCTAHVHQVLPHYQPDISKSLQLCFASSTLSAVSTPVADGNCSKTDERDVHIHLVTSFAPTVRNKLYRNTLQHRSVLWIHPDESSIADSRRPFLSEMQRGLTQAGLLPVGNNGWFYRDGLFGWRRSAWRESLRGVGAMLSLALLLPHSGIETFPVFRAAVLHPCPS